MAFVTNMRYAKKIPVLTANKVLSKAIVHPSSLNLVMTGPLQYKVITVIK